MTKQTKPAPRKAKQARRRHADELRFWKRQCKQRFSSEIRDIIGEFVAKTEAEQEKPVDPTRDRIIRHAWAMMGMLIEQKQLDPWSLGEVRGDKDKIEIFDEIQDWIDGLYLSLVGIGLEWHD